MLPDDLAYRPKSDLIDLIHKQQSQIAELQAQLAQLQSSTRANGGEPGSAVLPAAQPVPAARFPLALKLTLFAAVALICAIAAIVAGYRPNALVNLGRIEDFPSGSVTPLYLPALERTGQATPILLVNDPVAGFLALYRQDPSSKCRLLVWEPTVRRIEDPCSGSKYTRTGEYIEGPAPRGLDQFWVEVTESGEVKVDTGRLQLGPPRP